MGQNNGHVRKAGEEKRMDSNNIHLRQEDLKLKLYKTDPLKVAFHYCSDHFVI